MNFEIVNEAAKKLLDLMDTERNARWNSEHFEIFHVLEKGRKYNRIVSDTRHKDTKEPFNQRSCAGFIDNEGNVYKSAGWKAPAKHVRGNIFTDKLGTDGTGFISYLR